MKKILLLLLLTSQIAWTQSKQDSVQFRELANEIMVNGEAYENLRELTQSIGNRISGSVGYDKATVWAEKKLKEAGADKVWLQETFVPVWVRGKETLKLKTQNGKWEDLNFLSLGNSEGTNGKDVEGEVIMVNTLGEFDKLSEKEVKDKIVFFNYRFRQDFITTFDGYSDAVLYRSVAAVKVAEKGGKFAMIRSVSTGVDDVPHTGTMRYNEQIQKIPAIAIGNQTADRLEHLTKSGKIYLKLNSNCGMKEEIINYNVIGEIKGKDDKIIVAGAHLDSWDVGEGAHDDGAGVVQVIEILRTFKKLGIQPNHTLRFICYANEENGARGGEKYAEEAKRKNENHLFALESDAGGFSPRGFSLDMPLNKIKEIQAWKPLFLPYGTYDINKGYGGVDIHPLGRLLQTPLAGLIPDSQRYFDIHHTAADTFDKVNKRELQLGATVMAQLIYMIDKNW
ncbi:M20/M25/M40 family metallo-hydrolase [Flavobacterium dauae]|uniref:M20/M25/M40 family metallo-hydrolase n=1 Tax=Flavobacterium dauae TaxID=1563479 RepID=UPI00101B4ADA|nr:M20/M25/M40 family metallo-hydrolase [Flavobacterium dauae]WLD24005.1 M20/M25/M40 family metallo-hydrolase [Flavobacterium dauae]